MDDVDFNDLTTWPVGLLLDAIEHDRLACTRLAIAFDLASNAAYMISPPRDKFQGVEVAAKKLKTAWQKTKRKNSLLRRRT